MLDAESTDIDVSDVESGTPSVVDVVMCEAVEADVAVVVVGDVVIEDPVVVAEIDDPAVIVEEEVREEWQGWEGVICCVDNDGPGGIEGCSVSSLSNPVPAPAPPVEEEMGESIDIEESLEAASSISPSSFVPPLPPPLPRGVQFSPRPLEGRMPTGFVVGLEAEAEEGEREARTSSDWMMDSTSSMHIRTFSGFRSMGMGE
jgi:hypothetical protein